LRASNHAGSLCHPIPMSTVPLVTIVDDDESVRESLVCFLESMRMRVAAFASAEAFLASDARATTACLLLDFTLTGMSGRELQQALLRDERPPAIIFITAVGDEHFRTLVLARGAIACLQKPFDDSVLLTAIDRALERSGRGACDG
jgi:FixJ family two-component response regulator